MPAIHSIRKLIQQVIFLRCRYDTQTAPCYATKVVPKLSHSNSKLSLQHMHSHGSKCLTTVTIDNIVMFLLQSRFGLADCFTSLSKNTFVGPSTGTPNARNLYRSDSSNSIAFFVAVNSEPNKLFRHLHPWGVVARERGDCLSKQYPTNLGNSRPYIRATRFGITCHPLTTSSIRLSSPPPLLDASQAP